MTNNPWASEEAKSWKLIDGRRYSGPSTLEFDVVVIGSGAGGGIAAEELAKAGFNVGIIEDGSLNTSADFGKNEADSYSRLYHDSGSRMTADKGIALFQGRGVGGSTVVNWTSSFHLPDPTLKHWQDNFGVNWNKSELNDHTRIVEERLGIELWALPPNRNNEMIETGLNNLGYHPKRIPRNVKHCLNLGYCGLGCPVNAKQSMLVTTIPEALRLGSTLIYNSFALKFHFAAGSVQALECHPSLGNGEINHQPLMIKAKHFVLSGGAVGSPSLLLRSHAPDPYGRLGLATTLHPTVISGGIYDEKIFGFQGAPQSVYSDDFLSADDLTKVPGFKIEAAPVFPLLLSALLPARAEEHREIMSNMTSVQGSIALIRDGFHRDAPGGTVSINSAGRPVIDYPWSKTLEKSALQALETMAEYQFASGAEKVYPLHADATSCTKLSDVKRMLGNLSMRAPGLRIVSAHAMGGCGMGDERSGVVDSMGKHHQLDNLTVCDGSIFPTSLGTNPQLTIYATAHMIGKHVATLL